jgi:hypothetical protein
VPSWEAMCPYALDTSGNVVMNHLLSCLCDCDSIPLWNQEVNGPNGTSLH